MISRPWPVLAFLWCVFFCFLHLPCLLITMCMRAIILSRAQDSSLLGGTSICKLRLSWWILDVNIFAQGPCWVQWLSLKVDRGDLLTGDVSATLSKKWCHTGKLFPTAFCPQNLNLKGTFSLTVHQFPQLSNRHIKIIAPRSNERDNEMFNCASALTVVQR